MENKNVKLLIISSDPRHTTDMAYQVRNIFTKLPDHFDTTILTPGESNPIKINKAKIYPVLGDHYGDVGTIRAAYKKIKPDILLLAADITTVGHVILADNEFKQSHFILYDAVGTKPFLKRLRGAIRAVHYVKYNAERPIEELYACPYVPFGIDMDNEYKILSTQELGEIKQKVLGGDDRYVFLWDQPNTKRTNPLVVMDAFHDLWQQHNDTALIMNVQYRARDAVVLEYYLNEQLPKKIPIIINNQKDPQQSIQNNALYMIAKTLISIPSYGKFEFNVLKALASGIGVISSCPADDFKNIIDDHHDGQITTHVNISGDNVTPYREEKITSTEDLTERMSRHITRTPNNGNAIRNEIYENHNITNVMNTWIKFLNELSRTAPNPKPLRVTHYG